MAVNAPLRAKLTFAAGEYVIFQLFGVTRASVQVTRISTGSNINTTFDVQYSNDGANFVSYATPKTIALSSPAGSYLLSPIQIGCTEPFDINATWIKVSPLANASASDEGYVDVLAVDQVTPGGSVIESIQGSAKAIPTQNGVILSSSPGGVGFSQTFVPGGIDSGGFSP